VDNARASILVDWEKEIMVDNCGNLGYLDDFYTEPEKTIPNITDRSSFQASNNVCPRLITFFAHYADNGQMGPSALSLYARVDGEIKQVHVWDYCVSPEQARHRYSSFVDKVSLPLAILIKESATKQELLLPDPLLGLVAEFLWDDACSRGGDGLKPAQLIDRLVKLFFRGKKEE
jgi:hypothetical protein